MLIKKKSLKFTKGQSELIDQVVDWFILDSFNEPEFVYGGSAGTGKTTIIPSIIEKLGLYPNEVLFVAFTGKAASVLIQKGIDAQTIHSAFYDIVEEPLIKNGEVVKKNGRVVKIATFKPKEFIDPKIKLIVVDEWSMVGKDLADTMYRYNVPILASGDWYQLPPIFGESPFKSKIRYELTEITRQAKDNGIICLANRFRHGESVYPRLNMYNDARVLSKKMLTDEDLLKNDMVLVTKNKTRDTFNNKIRKLHGSDGKLPCVGDKLICRKNNWSLTLDGIPLVNGIIGKVVNPIDRSMCDLTNGIYRIDFQPDYVTDEFSFYESIPCDYGFLNSSCANKQMDRYNFGCKMEYGEAITVHSAQGSQANHVLYWDEPYGDQEFVNRLRYTAVTRAVKTITMFM